MKVADYDLLVIGGGINGVGVAYDAAGRGLSVCLCEMGDLAGATSSSSSKLIHGGLRYLEQCEFRLVREALAEREILLKIAPHITRPLRFYLPHQSELRPAWMVQLGLFLYDHLSKRNTLTGSRRVKLDGGSPLKSTFNTVFEYSDVWVDDARLVLLNALGLRDHGGSVFTRTKVVSGFRRNDLWHICLEDQLTGTTKEVTSKALVNAAGPWVSGVLAGLSKEPEKSDKRVRLVKGSHIVVPGLYQGSQAYILQNHDKRVVFVSPFLGDYSLIGTTEVEYNGDPGAATCSEQEREYLCRVVNDHFKTTISVEDIIWDFSGVRPLFEDKSSDARTATRDYAFELEDEDGKAPLLSVFGGKLTTYRKLGEHAMNRLASYFPMATGAWTQSSLLPGAVQVVSCLQVIQQRYPWLPDSVAIRYAHSYGSLADKFLNGMGCISDLGIDFGSGLYQCEVDYLIRNEWVIEAEDLLWRRSKLGLFLSTEESSVLADYIKSSIRQVSENGTLNRIV
ncbi:glycerol-3-phosphate dehydrogenase [Endozoicomonas sp.]|uniref:glycerol-3-phosphate dehydrogenase n=1 Tax=Endozoicomonas sp. TaxID=1892382 RepID=UPI002886803C|nr:glycerol-3-phosphate dehydrogenase [Endozoicomonas sp.]